MFSLKPSMTLTPRRDNMLIDMDITSKKEKQLLMTMKLKRSEMLLTEENDKTHQKRQKVTVNANAIVNNKEKTNKVISKSLTTKDLKPKTNFPLVCNNTTRRSNLTTNNHKYKKRPLNFQQNANSFVYK